jgi:hypothetical protein
MTISADMGSGRGLGWGVWHCFWDLFSELSSGCGFRALYWGVTSVKRSDLG